MSENHDDDKTQSYTPLNKDTMVGHYRIISKIGAGGMGEVYLAEDTKLDRKVALKFLPPHLCQNENCRKRFKREAQAAAKLSHPNIIHVYEVSEYQGRPFFAMEHAEGESLRNIVRGKELGTDRIIELAMQICDGLGAAHEKKVIHRDIKPSNIVIDAYGRPKILDFGLAAIQGGEQLTKTGSTLGTVRYMSPEQVQGQKVDQRSDLFSLGVVLYELISGRTPFERENEVATLKAITQDIPEPLARYKSGISDELQRTVFKLLEKNPSMRYQSALGVISDLKRLGTLALEVESKEPSIAILPFANMSPDPNNEYFADGLTEELLNVLARNPELKVSGRTSSFAFKGKQEDLRVIGRKLGVTSLLEGSVRKAGNKVRITAQLVNVTDGFHLWSETYDRILDDIFAVQDDIARAVSKAMQVTLTGVRETKRTTDPESYALALRARQMFQQMNAEGLSLAVKLYSKSVELDPQYARAWAELGTTYAVRIAYGHGDYETEYPLAKAAAEKALALDDQSPAAHSSMGLICAALELQIKKGVIHARRAYELAPNDSAIVSAMATCEMILGNFDRAIHLAEKSINLDPLDSFGYREYGRILSLVGNYDEALKMYNKALEMSPDSTMIYSAIGGIKVSLEQYDEALDSIEKEKVDGYRHYGKAITLYAMGRRTESDQCLEELIAEHERSNHWSFQIAIVYAFKGETDKAFEWLERAYDDHDAGVPMTKVTRHLKSLHTDPRWAVFLEKIGLAD